MSNTLHLPLKAQWYEMIESGVKREEYRILSHYWVQRLCVWSDGRKIGKSDAEFLASNISYLISAIDEGKILFVNCTYVKFSFGYTKRTMTFGVKGIVLGKGNPEWGAPDEMVFIIKLRRKMVQRIFGDDTRKRVSQKIWGRYQNIIWRDRHEEWEHDGQRYMSGDNFRNKDDWYAVEAHEEDKPYSPYWHTPYSYRLVYFRGGVYKSVSWGGYEKMIFLYSRHGGHGFMMNVTSCAPVLPIIGK